MSLIQTLTITADGRVAVPIVPHNNNKDGRITFAVDPQADFDNGTVTVQYGFTDDVATDAKWNGNVDNGSAVTFTAAQIRNISLNSDQRAPIYIGFLMAESTSPNVTIRIYDTRC